MWLFMAFCNHKSQYLSKSITDKCSTLLSFQPSCSHFKRKKNHYELFVEWSATRNVKICRLLVLPVEVQVTCRSSHFWMTDSSTDSSKCLQCVLTEDIVLHLAAALLIQEKHNVGYSSPKGIYLPWLYFSVYVLFDRMSFLTQSSYVQ